MDGYGGLVDWIELFDEKYRREEQHICNAHVTDHAKMVLSFRRGRSFPDEGRNGGDSQLLSQVVADQNPPHDLPSSPSC